MKKDISKVIANLTLFEKASLCSGLNFWETKAIPRMDIPSIVMSDGPHGLRKENNDDTDNVALKSSFPATSFPPAVNMASSWNPELIKKVGVALGEQCLNQGVDVILGPGTNIKRSPLCGRSFEYFSEDPYLAGKMCVGYIDGVQSTGIGTSLKHFAVNSQEYLRMTINEIIDERTLRELYLPAFEMAVKESNPATVMCSYNRINGVYSSDNKRLLTDILRNEWGFKGLVVSDWNAVNNRVAGILAGMDIEMPSCGGKTDKQIVNAVINGEIKESDLDIVVERILNLVYDCVKARDDEYPYNYRDGHKLARKVADESMVLLKNTKTLLPLSPDAEIAVIGELARTPRYQGAGSSRINPYKLVGFTNYLDSHNISYSFAEGYTLSNDGYKEELFNEAIELAKSKKTVLLCVGLTDSYESEGYDRAHMSLPESHNRLISEICKVNENVIVILFGGSPVEMPWINEVSTLLNAYLPGEAGGEALADIIYGIVNPSGKLAETYPVKLSDYIGSQYYRGGPKNVEHREGIYIGYRYYDSARKEVLFPFGHGLSYTQFEYGKLIIEKSAMRDDESVNVSFSIKNVGDRAGAEIAQLYVKPTDSKIFKAEKELKGFRKVFLQPGEEKTITLTLDKRSFAYYNTNINDWYVESGEYLILVGASSRNILLNGSIYVQTTGREEDAQDLRESLPTYYNIAEAVSIPDEEFKSLYGDEIPSNLPSERGSFNWNTNVGELRCCLAGKIFLKIAPIIIKGQMPDADMTAMLMIQQGMEEMPMRGLGGITSGLLDDKVMEGLLLWGNRHRTKGLFRIIAGLIKSVKNIVTTKKTDSRMKMEKKQYQLNKQKLIEEQRKNTSVQKQALKDLNENLKELEKLRNNASDDIQANEILKHISIYEQMIDSQTHKLESIKEQNKTDLEAFKKSRQEEIKQIREEEKQIKKAIKAYVDEMDDNYSADMSKEKKNLLSKIAGSMKIFSSDDEKEEK